jgi:hypothetical protein
LSSLDTRGMWAQPSMVKVEPGTGFPCRSVPPGRDTFTVTGFPNGSIYGTGYCDVG